jgi:hypothetical protein
MHAGNVGDYSILFYPIFSQMQPIFSKKSKNFSKEAEAFPKSCGKYSRIRKITAAKAFPQSGQRQRYPEPWLQDTPAADPRRRHRSPDKSMPNQKLPKR